MNGKYMPAAGSYSNFHCVLIGVYHIWWTSLEGLLLKMEALSVQVGVSKNEFPSRVVWGKPLEKETPIKGLLVATTPPIAPITTTPTALAND